MLTHVPKDAMLKDRACSQGLRKFAFTYSFSVILRLAAERADIGAREARDVPFS